MRRVTLGTMRADRCVELSGRYPGAVVSLARDLRQVRQLREQDRRSPELERIAAEPEPDRQSVAIKNEAFLPYVKARHAFAAQNYNSCWGAAESPTGRRGGPLSVGVGRRGAFGGPVHDLRVSAS
jgi:hypothetical protein